MTLLIIFLLIVAIIAVFTICRDKEQDNPGDTNRYDNEPDGTDHSQGDTGGDGGGAGSSGGDY